MNEDLDQDREPPEETIALAFLDLYLRDRREGRVLPLSHYLALFHDHERTIASEYFGALPEGGSSPTRSPLAGGAASVRAPAALGPYTLKSVIGEGGQGTVWLAEDARLRRTVAVKVLRDAGPGAESRVRRFRRETETMSKLCHPCICVIHDAGITDGLPWFAMQYVEGETLAARLTRLRDEGLAAARAGATDSINAFVATCEKLSRALHVAHEKGVVHRDLKPGNVMLSTTGDPVILDFGLARDAASSHDISQSGDLFGTPAYMAPEQLRGNHGEVDRRSDVWALGAILYECVTLHRPFEDTGREALFQAIVSRDPANPRSFTPAIPEDLRSVLGAAMEKDPSRRYQTALAFAEDLRAILEGRPVAASRIGPVGRAVRWGRREPMKATLAAVTLAAFALVAALGGYYLATRADVEAGRNASLARRCDELLSDGYAEFGEGDSASAVVHFAGVLALAPQSVDAASGMVLAYLRQGDPSRALEALDRHAGVFAGGFSAVALRAEVLELQGAAKDAATLRRSMPAPADASDWFLAGQLRLAEGHATKTASFRLAVDAFTTAIMLSRSPKAPYYEARLHAAGHARDTQAVDVTIRTIGHHWPHSPGSHRGAGRAYLDLGRPAEAVPEIREALRLNPKAPELPSLHARALARTGSFDEAIAVLQASIEAYPRRLGDRHEIGGILVQRGRASEALREFDSELELSPRKVETHVERSRALWSLGRRGEAIEALRTAVNLAPDHLIALVNLGTALKRSGDRAAAESFYRRAIALRPGCDDPASLGMIASALWDCGDRDAAFRTSKESVARWPRDADSHHRLGILFAKSSQPDDAIIAFRRALEIDATRTDIRLDLAFALSGGGMKRDAIPELEAFLDKTPGPLEIRSLLGICHVEAGDRRRGLEMLRREREAAPASPRIAFDSGKALFLTGAFGEALSILRPAQEAGIGDPGLLASIVQLSGWCDDALQLQPVAEAIRAGGPLPKDPEEGARLCELASRRGWHAESAGWYRRLAGGIPAFAGALTDDQVVCVVVSSLATCREWSSRPGTRPTTADPAANRGQAMALITMLLDRWRRALAGGTPEPASVRMSARALEDEPEIRRLAAPSAVIGLPSAEAARWTALFADLAILAGRPK